MAVLESIDNGSTFLYVKATEAIHSFGARVGKFVKSEKGVTAVEYAIVVGGVAAVVAIIFGKEDDSPVKAMLTNIFKTVQDSVTGSINNTTNGGGGSGGS